VKKIVLDIPLITTETCSTF